MLAVIVAAAAGVRHPVPVDEASRIPLRDSTGTVKAWALVDRDVYEWASLTPWYLVGSIGRQFVARWENGKHVYLHRLILGLAAGDSRTGKHINRDRLDNRRANLRTSLPL